MITWNRNIRISQRTNPAALKKSQQTDFCYGRWIAVVKKINYINIAFFNNIMKFVTHKFDKKK